MLLKSFNLSVQGGETSFRYHVTKPNAERSTAGRIKTTSEFGIGSCFDDVFIRDFTAG